MKNFVQEGDTLTLAPGADVASGIGFLFGAALFGVATKAATNGVASTFQVIGVVEIGKTSALAISVGDRLFWDSTSSARLSPMTFPRRHRRRWRVRGPLSSSVG